MTAIVTSKPVTEPPPAAHAARLLPGYPPPSTARRHLVLRRLAHNRLGLAGGALVLIIAIAAVAAPLLTPHDPDQVNLALRIKPPGTAGYTLGSDIYGRDLLSRLIWGGRVSLAMGLAAMV
ncbi:MAG: ABC transporter permease, partial [Chloroflexi bacterium]